MMLPAKIFSYAFIAVAILFGSATCPLFGIDPRLNEAHQAWRSFMEHFRPTMIREEANERHVQQDVFHGHAMVYKEGKGCRLVEAETFQDGKWNGLVYARNPRYAFELKRSDRGRPWVMTNLSIFAKNEQAASVERMLDLHASETAFPLKANSANLIELVDSPQFKLTKYETVSSNDTDLVEVGFTIKDPKAKLSNGFPIRFTSGTMLLDIRSNWLPTRITLTWPDKTAIEKTLLAFDEHSGLAYPTQYLLTGITADGQRWERAKYSFSEIKFDDPVSESEFTLTHYDLPEPPGSESRRLTFTSVFAAGLLVMMVGIIFRRYARHA